MSNEFFRILGSNRTTKTVRIEGGAPLAVRLRKAGEKATVLTDGSVALEADDVTVTKVSDGLYRAVVFASDGSPLLIDNPHASPKFYSLSKRASLDSFAAAHGKLSRRFVGPDLTHLAKGVIPGQDRETQRLTKAVSAIHAGTVQRNERNRKLRTAIGMAAKSHYQTEAEAARGLRKALRSQFSAVELDAMGLL